MNTPKELHSRKLEKSEIWEHKHSKGRNHSCLLLLKCLCIQMPSPGDVRATSFHRTFWQEFAVNGGSQGEPRTVPLPGVRAQSVRGLQSWTGIQESSIHTTAWYKGTDTTYPRQHLFRLFLHTSKARILHNFPKESTMLLKNAMRKFFLVRFFPAEV